MKKIIILFCGLILATVTMTDCRKDNPPVAKTYTVTVNVSAEAGIELSDVGSLKVTMTNNANAESQELTLTNGTAVVEALGGAYTFLATGTFDDQTLTASKEEEVYSDKRVDLKMEIIVAGGGLVIKEIYYTNVMSYYFRDGFVELFNNSDETVYLDGIIVGFVDDGMANMNSPTASMWRDGALKEALGNRVPMGSAVMYFPGGGSDYPLAAGKGVVIATQAIDHSARVLGDNDKKSPVNLSNADWEFWAENFSAGLPDNLNVPNLKFAYWNSSRPQMMANSRNVHPMLIAKLPGGLTMEAFLSDTNNFIDRSQGSLPSYFTYLVMPAEYIIDIVDMVSGVATERSWKHVDAPLDSGATWIDGSDDGSGTAGQLTGKSARRKVLYVKDNGRIIYRDTNNSTVDFITGGVVPKPGVHATAPDA